MDRIIECVPNFSEGRDQQVLDKITTAISGAGGKVLGSEADADYNRSVVTFVASPEEVAAAAVAGVAMAAECIDMQAHSGGHPRMGAADVVPFVPVKGVTMEECVAVAKAAGKQIGDELGLPVYMYGEAAMNPERRDLAKVRNRQYEALEKWIPTEEGRPDFGPATFHARFGATCVGARPFLVAFNVNLEGGDLTLAQNVARQVRESGYLEDGTRQAGLLKKVKAMGVELSGKGIFQVSMNLLDTSVTSVYKAYETVDRMARMWGSSATSCEIVGLAPLQALKDVGAQFAWKSGKDPATQSDLELVNWAVIGLELDSMAPFDPKEKVLEFKIA